MMEFEPEIRSQAKEYILEESVYNCLALPEILDCILSYLPTTDLLLARCVCPSWTRTANQLLTNSHMQNIKISLRHTGSGFGLQEFLSLSNSCHGSPFFQQLQNFLIDCGDDYGEEDIQQFEVDKPHFQNLFSKYSKCIKCIELADYSAAVVAEFVLHKENLSQLSNLQQLRISGNITSDFLQSSAFDISQIARLTSIGFGAGQDLTGQNKLLAALSTAVESKNNNNNLSSIILGGGTFSALQHGPTGQLNLNPQILECLFKHLSSLQVFQNYAGEVRSVGRPRFAVDNPHLMAMTTNCCKLKRLKLMMGNKHFNASQTDRNVFWDFLTSHSTSLESISLVYDSFHDHNTNFHETFILWNNLPNLPMLTSLELSSCTNISFLSQTPDLVKLSMIDPVLNCFNEFSEQVDCPSLKSLTIDVSLGRNKLTQNAKNQTELVQKVTAGAPNLEEFVMVISNAWETVRLELSLKRVEVEKVLFKDSQFMKQFEYSQLTEAELQDLEETKDFINSFVNIILANCSKFFTVDELSRNEDVPNQASSVCLLSHGLRYQDIKKKLASIRRLTTTTTSPRFAEYRFVNLIDSELPTFFLLSKSSTS